MSDIADAWEAYSQREIAMLERRAKSRFCGECRHERRIPSHAGNTEWGFCVVNDSYVYEGTSTAESGCEEWSGQWA